MVNFENEFRKSGGQPFERNGIKYHLAFTVDASNCLKLTLHFEQARPPYRQGVHLESEQLIRVAGEENRAILLWHDTAPQEVECDCSNAGSIQIWNIWDTGDGTVHSWHSGAAMIVEAIGIDQWQFRCNDGHPDDDCDDLLFRISLE